VAKLADA